MTVVMEYEEQAVNENGRLETRVWRAVFSDEESAIAQAGQDIAEGRNPVRVVEDDGTGNDPARRTQARTAKKLLIDTADLQARARKHGPTFI